MKEQSDVPESRSLSELLLALKTETQYRKRAEQDLANRQLDFSYLFEQNPLPMWIYEEKNLRFVEVNEAAVRQYGYKREEFLAMHLADMMPTDLVERLRTGRKTEASYQHSSSWHLPHKDGTVLEVDIVSHAMVFQGGPCFLVFALDVTERNATEARLRRTEKLETLGQLTGGVAHDFNNLLTVIQGSLERIGGENCTAETHACVRDALNSVARGARLTHRLLAYAQQQPLDPKAVSVRVLIQEMRELMERIAGATIHLEINLPEELWMTRIDPGQLEDALLNLLVNARDAMPAGGTLKIEASNCVVTNEQTRKEPEIGAGEYLLLTITDSGTGMSQEVAKRVLEPFFTTKAVGKGNGLGLSMVYGFVMQSGGSLQIISVLNQGTAVLLYLPRTAGMMLPVAPLKAETLPERGKGQVILVVEDDPTIRMIVTKLLTSMGYQPVEAEDGRVGLRLIKELLHIDLMLTDITMPNSVSGVELAELAREQIPELKVLFMSGYMKDTIPRLEKYGGTVHLLPKPFGAQELASGQFSIAFDIV